MSDQDLNAIQYHGMRPRCGVVAVRRNDIDGHEVCVIDKTPDPLTSENLVLDKQGDTWVLTYKPKHKPVVLRLKIRHCCVWDRDDFIAEVLNQSDDRFRWIHECSVDSAYFLADNTPPDKETAAEWQKLPDIWTEEFAAMIGAWGRMKDLTEFGATHERPVLGLRARPTCCDGRVA